MTAGRLHLYGGATNPLGSATLGLGGAGAADVVLDTHNGAPTFDNPVVVTANARIEDFNDVVTTTVGGVNGVSVASGTTLTLDAVAGTPAGPRRAPSWPSPAPSAGRAR